MRTSLDVVSGGGRGREEGIYLTFKVLSIGLQSLIYKYHSLWVFVKSGVGRGLTHLATSSVCASIVKFKPVFTSTLVL